MKSNKKRIIFVLAILTMALVLSCALVACNKTDTPDAPKKEFTITFDTQGGSEVKPLVLKEGETITLPSNPAKEGYVFDGWYLDSSYTQAFDSTKRIDSNMVLYAKWKILDDGQSIIASDYFDINGLVLTMNKQKYITSSEDVFDLRNKFSTSTGSGWRAFTSPNCDQPTEITSRTTNVSAGWNNIYVKVENLTTYENQIYQLKIYRYPTIVYRELKDGFLEIQSVSDCADVLFPDDKIGKITSIGENAFSSCPSLRTLQNLPKLTNIGTSAFANCTGLTNITIPNSVTSIGSYAFSGCGGLTSITIPDSVTSIGEGAFSGCSSLESITIPFVGAKAGVTSNGTYQYPFGYIFGTSSYAGGVATKQYYYGDSTSSTTSTTYYIPSSLKSVTVTGGNILHGAFRGCTALTSITIPDSVTSIGNSAFFGCKGLTSITIPVSVTSIGDSAFSRCNNLQDIYITDIAAWCNISGLNKLMGYGSSNKKLYINNELATSITIPNGVTKIPSNAFRGCTGLTSVTISDSVTSIDDSAFFGCSGLTRITIPDSVTNIGNSAFGGCTGLTSVKIGNGVTSIAYGAFSNCTGLSSVMVAEGNAIYHSADNCVIQTENKILVLGCKTSVIPADGSVSRISDYAFFSCSGLTSVTIPDSVTSIGEGAFAYCYGLINITIPNSVTSIGESAFYNCTGLTSIKIPDGVTSIGSDAFYGCYRLIEVYNKSALSITAGSSSNGYVAYYAKNVYTNEGGSKLTTDENGYVIYTDGDEKILVAYLGTNAELVLPSNITKIYKYAFWGCTGLTSVTIGNSVTRIGSSAFSGCTGLTSIIVDEGNTKYHSAGNCLIETATKTLILGCKTSVIPAEGSVTSIGNYAFYNCSGLTSITIPGGVSSIGISAFARCTGLTSITIGNSVTYIEDSAFDNCTGLTSITIPNSVTSIGGYAFQGCTGLTSITIPDSVTRIGYAAFAGCSGLTNIIFNGTIAQWKSISNNVPSTCIVHCTDGDIKA